MSQGQIFFIHQPQAPHWQLGALASTAHPVSLLSWQQPQPQLDAGMPAPVAEILVRAWASIASISFLSDKLLPDTAVGQSLRLDDGAWLAALYSRLKGQSAQTFLHSTTQAQTAMALFDDEAYPWCLQAQLVLLSKPDAPMAWPEKQALLSLMEDDWIRNAAPLFAQGLLAVVRPGVDGDVLGICCANSAVEAALIEALEQETNRAGYRWQIVPESTLIAQ